METVKDCHYPWTWMVIQSDGDVRPCCFATGSIGNVNTSSVDEIWNGKTIVELRKAILKDRVHPVCAKATCKFVQNMQPNV